MSENTKSQKPFIWGQIFKKEMKRAKVLSEFIKKDIDNELKEYPCEPEFLDVITKAKQEVQAIRISPELMDLVLPILNQNYTDIEVLNSVDALINEGAGGWWPDNHLKDAVYTFLTDKVKKLDVTQPAFVIGSAGLARSVIAGLVKLGVKKINLCSPNADEAKRVIVDFKKVLFETQFVFTDKDQRTLLPGVHGVVVNTLDYIEDDDFLSELYYFNFLKKGGIVIDMSELPIETPFIRIAKDIHAETFVGYEILAYQDYFWLKRARGYSLDLPKYIAFLKTELEKLPVDTSKMLKIFEDFQIK